MPAVGPCPWRVPVASVPPHCWLSSSRSEYEILVFCAAATSPLQSHLLAQTGSRGLALDLCVERELGSWQWICEWTGIWGLAAEPCMDKEPELAAHPCEAETGTSQACPSLPEQPGHPSGGCPGSIPQPRVTPPVSPPGGGEQRGDRRS